METQLIIRIAIVLLALTGAGGLLMAGIRLAGQPRPPGSIAMGHGLLAAAALVLLLYAAFTRGLPGMAWTGFALLAGAVLGGLLLNLGYHRKELPLPIWLVLVHGSVALVGLVVLALAGWNVMAA